MTHERNIKSTESESVPSQRPFVQVAFARALHAALDEIRVTDPGFELTMVAAEGLMAPEREGESSRALLDALIDDGLLVYAGISSRTRDHVPLYEFANPDQSPPTDHHSFIGIPGVVGRL